MGGVVGYVPREVLERPITLRDNVGHVNDPVTTKNTEAQTFYNQGMAYVHSYVWIDAARSFNRLCGWIPLLRWRTLVYSACLSILTTLSLPAKKLNKRKLCNPQSPTANAVASKSA